MHSGDTPFFPTTHAHSQHIDNMIGAMIKSYLLFSHIAIEFVQKKKETVNAISLFCILEAIIVQIVKHISHDTNRHGSSILHGYRVHQYPPASARQFHQHVV